MLISENKSSYKHIFLPLVYTYLIIVPLFTKDLMISTHADVCARYRHAKMNTYLQRANSILTEIVHNQFFKQLSGGALKDLWNVQWEQKGRRD